MEREYFMKKICDYLEKMDLSTLRMVCGFTRKLVE